MSADKKLTVLVIPLDGFGHINACVAVSQQLAQRGHRVVFALEQAWKGTVSKYEGLQEVHFTDPTRDPTLKANEYWFEFMLSFRKGFGLDPVEALKEVDEKLNEDFLYVMFNVDDQLTRIIGEIKPDVIILDNYNTVPAVYKAGIPWVWLTSAGPLICLPSDDLPPSRTGQFDIIKPRFNSLFFYRIPAR